MKLSGPIITLIAGAGLAGTLLIANLAVSSGSPPTATPQAASSNGAVASTASSTPGRAGGTPTASAGTGAATTSAATGNAVATGTGAAVQRGTYVGHVAGAGRLALVVHDGVAIAYLCDGRSIEAWFTGPARSGTVQLNGRKGAALVGSYDRSHATGTVVIGGVERRYDIAWVAKPSGLYRATARLRGAEVKAGWIVLPDGSQVGLLSNAADGTAPQAVPPLNLSSTSATVDGTTLVAVPVDSDSGSGF